MKQLLFRQRRLANRLQNSFVDFLEDARHDREYGRPDFEQILGQRLRAFRVSNRYSSPEVDVVERPLVNVAQGQKRHANVAAAKREQALAGLNVGDDVRMGQHNSLGYSHCSRGVEDARRFLGPNVERSRPKALNRVGGPLELARDQTIPALHAAIAQTDGLHRHNEPQLRQLRSHVQNFLELRRRADDAFRPRISQDVFDVGLEQRGIDGHDHRPQAQHRVVRQRPLDAILREKRHPVASPDAQAIEGSRQSRNSAQGFFGRQTLVTSAELGKESIRARAPLRRDQEELGDRLQVLGFRRLAIRHFRSRPRPWNPRRDSRARRVTPQL